jgi:hypothetical protein
MCTHDKKIREYWLSFALFVNIVFIVRTSHLAADHPPHRVLQATDTPRIRNILQ